MENISFVKNKNMTFSNAIYNGNTEIRNIIFDWGGVITDLHFEKTKQAFLDLGLAIWDESVPHDPQNDLFIPFEIGTISAAQFRQRVRGYCSHQIEDELIDNAWNAMLGDLPEERWEILKEAKKRYQTYLLSNTNSIHLPYYFGRINEMYGKYGYTHLFNRTYFSYELGLRKPNADIFKYVIKDAGIIPEETMFIDDFIENIDTAKLMGFQTIHLKAPLTLKDVFEE
jgi:putative hydrolase of the HAD superfamily